MKVRKIKPNNKNNKGFTLVEVLLAIVILSLVSAPILRGFIVTANTSARARKIMEATDVAQLIIEEVSAMSYEKGVKDTFLTDDVIERLPAIDDDPDPNDGIDNSGYKAAGTAINVAGLIPAQIPGAFRTNVAGVATDNKKCYRGQHPTWGDIVALPNVEYDGKKYDVIISFLPNTSEGTTYYTYDVIVEVYDQDIVTDSDGNVSYTHYRNMLVKLKTEISNKY